MKRRFPAQPPHHTMLDGRMVTRYGSDGPFLRKHDDGTLILTWSPYKVYLEVPFVTGAREPEVFVCREEPLRI